MNLRCLILGHNYKRIGSIKKVQVSEFDKRYWMLALGECRRCEKRKPREVIGAHGLLDFSRTLEEAKEEWEEELEQPE